MTLPSIRPLGLVGSILMFGVPTAVVSGTVLGLLPGMIRHGFTPYLTFLVCFLGPLALMFFAVFVAYRLEGRPWSWAALRDRLRLRRMTRAELGWTLALVLGSFGLQVLMRPVVKGLEHVALFQWPEELTRFMAGMAQGDVGFPLDNRWDVWLTVTIGLAVFNVGGEELWWRGIILPRQEAAFGRWTWILHGVMWDLFHVFYYTNLGALVGNLAITMPLAFVAQRTRSTWPGIVLHYLINGGFPIIVLFKVLGRSPSF